MHNLQEPRQIIGVTLMRQAVGFELSSRWARFMTFRSLGPGGERISEGFQIILRLQRLLLKGDMSDIVTMAAARFGSSGLWDRHRRSRDPGRKWGKKWLHPALLKWLQLTESRKRHCPMSPLSHWNLCNWGSHVAKVSWRYYPCFQKAQRQRTAGSMIICGPIVAIKNLVIS